MITGPDTGGRSLYEVLGVDRTVGEADLVKAYRENARRTHPDRDGGNTAEFQVVKFAYEVLSDPVRRRDYDLNGITTHEDIEADAVDIIRQVVLEIIDMAPVGRFDIIEQVRHVIAIKIKEFHDIIRALQKKVAARKKALRRLVYAGSGDDFIAEGIKASIARHEEHIFKAQKQIAVGDLMSTMLNNHAFKVDSLYPFTSRAGNAEDDDGAGVPLLHNRMPS